MNLVKRRRINRLALMIHEALELSVPTDLDEAVIKLGGRVSKHPGLEPEARIEKIGDGFHIHLREGLAENRLRFSIAHELGHLFLHMGYLIDAKRWEGTEEYKDGPYYRFGFSKEESEANEFAAALLMPEDDFIEVSGAFISSTKCDLSAIADHFQVSQNAVKNRGRWLGLFTWK